MRFPVNVLINTNTERCKRNHIFGLGNPKLRSARGGVCIGASNVNKFYFSIHIHICILEEIECFKREWGSNFALGPVPVQRQAPVY